MDAIDIAINWTCSSPHPCFLTCRALYGKFSLQQSLVTESLSVELTVDVVMLFKYSIPNSTAHAQPSSPQSRRWPLLPTVYLPSDWFILTSRKRYEWLWLRSLLITLNHIQNNTSLSCWWGSSSLIQELTCLGSASISKVLKRRGTSRTSSQEASAGLPRRRSAGAPPTPPQALSTCRGLKGWMKACGMDEGVWAWILVFYNVFGLI